MQWAEKSNILKLLQRTVGWCEAVAGGKWTHLGAAAPNSVSVRCRKVDADGTQPLSREDISETCIW